MLYTFLGEKKAVIDFRLHTQNVAKCFFLLLFFYQGGQRECVCKFKHLIQTYFLHLIQSMYHIILDYKLTAQHILNIYISVYNFVGQIVIYTTEVRVRF